jgi:pyruvate formate-lyase/glycerol dehydratase family glycyl radical enzyme
MEGPTRSWIGQLPVCRGGTAVPIGRVVRLKDRILSTERRLYVEPARLMTESFRRTEGEPAIARRAKAFRDIVRGMTITIHPDELLVGNRSPLPRMGVVTPSAAVDWIDKELETLSTRPQDPFQVDPEDIRVLREKVFPYWRGKTLEDVVAAAIPPDVQVARDCKVVKLNQTDHAQGHILPDVETWLSEGVSGLKARAIAVRDRRNRQGELTQEQEQFYEAAIICLDAAAEFMHRYGDLASEQARSTNSPRLRTQGSRSGQAGQAQEERSPQRRRELERIARNCHHLACEPPRDYWEALQAIWFLFVLLQVESNASSFSPGRLDQYLLPFLRQDLAAGGLTPGQAQELLECLWLKFNEIVLLRSAHSARYFAGFPIGFNVIVGGQLADGTDATNELSYMCLQAQADVGLPQPNFSVRLHKHTPQDLLLGAARVIRMGSGMPQLFNDEVIVPAYENRGVTHEDAMNYAVVGCVELSIPGKTMGWSDAAMFNLVRALEITLYGGVEPETGKQVGPPTGHLEELATFAEFEAAYAEQIRHFIALMVKGANIVDTLHARVCQTPFLSTVVDDCLEVGQDVTAGGAHYNFSGPQGVQVANMADSLAALKWMIYDEQEICPAELMTALRQNFCNAEALRQRLLNGPPKYGNDDDAVDLLGRKWARFYCDEVARYSNPRGGPFHPGFYTVSAHVPLGHNVGATPDGRLAYTPLADGGLSPVAGRDVKGPTAALWSVSKIDQKLVSNGALLNLKFLPSFFERDEALDWFTGFLRAFVELNVSHVQFNVVSGETLRRAQLHPELFRGLVVRVAGYSAYFVELDREIQDEIIRRTAHSEVCVNNVK